MENIMIKIAFIGCDSTHTEAYAKLFNFESSPLFGKGIVKSIYGESLKQAKEKAKKLNIEKVTDSLESAIEDIDLVMVIGRFGESHYQPTLEIIKKGIPVFVDKPFTVDINEAKKLIDLSKHFNTKLCSSSPLRFSKEVLDSKEKLKKINSELLSVNVTVPANCSDLGPDPRLNNSFFYGIHGIEILLELIGHDVLNIDYQYHKSKISVILTTSDKKNHILNLLTDVSEFYWLDIHSKRKSTHLNIKLDESYYLNVAKFLISDFINGKKTINIESTMLAVSILDHIEKNNPYK
jgi:predicted dehydrogenase